MKAAALVVSLSMLIGVCAGCSQNKLIELHNPADVLSLVDIDEEGVMDIAPEMVPLTAFPAMFSMPMPAAEGSKVSKNAKAEVDYSNTKDGYVMVKYLQKTTKPVKVIVTGPSGTPYTYTLKTTGEHEVFPLSDSNGSYTVAVYENVEGNKYATANSVKFDVSLADEFAPFLRPNQYVNYSPSSKVVVQAAELTKNAKNMTEQITAVYDYVVKNFTYDKQLAATVQSGYLPNLDAVFDKKTGICFDYAAVMTAMLRSQGVPTKLVIGYTGSVYHAWISTYSKETGWVESVYFDGKKWSLMDPTFDSTGGQSAAVREFIGDGKNYSAKYLY